MAISLTYTFSAGTRILSSQVNANFSTLATRALDKTGDTMTGNLLFTDATYDIGASGATRPRDLFLSRNATIGGTISVTGNSTLASGSGNAAIIGGGASASTLRFLEPSGSGSNYSEFKAQAQSGNVTYTLPAADGSAGALLRTDGAGALTWSLVQGTVTTLTDGATVDLNAATGNVFLLTAAGNRTINATTNAVSGQKMIIAHKASGADRTLTLTTGSSGAFRYGTDITALTATTSAKTDYIGCIYNAADSRWDVVAVIKGF